MKYICLNCKKEFEGRLNKYYCSEKCREHNRYLKRKNNPHYKKLQMLRDKKYYQSEKGKEKKKILHRGKKFRDYQNKWRRDKKYWREQYEKHPECHREKSTRFRKTINGKIATIRSNEKRRKKIFILTGKKLERLDEVFLQKIRERDLVCVYCKKEFDNSIYIHKETIDHLHCNEPLSENNAVRCCWSCNSSKRNIPLEKIPEWIIRKKFNPSPIVMKLIKKQKIKNLDSAKSVS
jgi:hypothetical protein